MNSSSSDDKEGATTTHVPIVDHLDPVDRAVEAKIARKFDWRVMPLLTLMYLFAYIDRSNSGNARVLGMAKDLELTGHRFNIGLSCFYVTYIIFEIPANLLCKMLGPKIWLPFLTLGFGIITVCSSTIQSFHGFIAVRIFLGMLEAGIMPGITYTLSCFYARHEIVSRIGLYASVSALSGAFGGLLATALTKIPSWGMIHTWRNIFFFEGLMSIILSVVAYILLPKSPGTASFVTAQERQVAEARITRDMKGRDNAKLSSRYFKRALYNLNTILITLVLFCSLMTVASMSLFTPTILVALGYSGIHAQLLSVPLFAWATLVCVSVSLLSDLTKRRGVWLLMVLPFTAVGFIILITVETVGVRYFALFLCLTGAFTTSAISVGWAVDNSAGQTVRAIVAATIAGFGNVGGIVATWTYTLDDAPRYIRGHALNLGFTCFAFLLVAASMFNLKRENDMRAKGRRDHQLNGLTEEEIADLGHMHPEFKFTL